VSSTLRSSGHLVIPYPDVEITFFRNVGKYSSKGTASDLLSLKSLSSTSVFPCQFHSIGFPLRGKMKEKLISFLFIFITGLHNKPQDCGASVASAAGPFTKIKKIPSCTVIGHRIMPMKKMQCRLELSRHLKDQIT
jgi:hypothetical protein